MQKISSSEITVRKTKNGKHFNPNSSCTSKHTLPLLIDDTLKDEMKRYLISGEMHIPRFHKIGALWVQNNSESKNYDSIVVNSTPIKSFTSEFI